MTPLIKVAPRPGATPSELRYKGRTVGAVIELDSGGVGYRPGWRLDAFSEPPPFPDASARLPAALRREHGPFRAEAELARRLEGAISQ